MGKKNIHNIYVDQGKFCIKNLYGNYDYLITIFKHTNIIPFPYEKVFHNCLFLMFGGNKKTVVKNHCELIYLLYMENTLIVKV